MKTNIIKLMLTLLLLAGVTLSYTPERGLGFTMVKIWALEDDDDYWDYCDYGDDFDDWDYFDYWDYWDNWEHYWDDVWLLEGVDVYGYRDDNKDDDWDDGWNDNDDYRWNDDDEDDYDDRDSPDQQPEPEECNGEVCSICGRFTETTQGENCQMCEGHIDDHNICNPNSMAYNPRQCVDTCKAHQTLWNNSFSYGMRETGAFILSNGSYFIFNNSRNGTHNTLVPDVAWIRGLPYAIMPDGGGELIVGVIHTHPDPNSTLSQGPTVYNDGSKDDFTLLEQLGGKMRDIDGYVISTDSVYRYYFDEHGKKIVELLGSRDSFSECP